ncbi:MAG: EamA family transporter [Burkholderia sp.]
MSGAAKGFALAVTAGFCWGSMAVAGQYLMTGFGFSAEDLGCLRVFGAGVILAVLSLLFHPKDARRIFTDPAVFRDVLVYGFGVLGVQYTCFLSIRDANAATAAIMVLTCPLFVIGWQALAEHRRVAGSEAAAFALATAGTVLLVTKGRFDALSFSAAGVFWGLLSAAIGAFCTLQPARVLKKISVMPLVGFGMLLSGTASLFFHSPSDIAGTFTPLSSALTLYIVAVGTALAFFCYLKSLAFVPPSVTAILAAFEPFFAVLLPVLLLGMSFSTAEVIGGLCIFAMVFVLAAGQRKAAAKAAAKPSPEC